MRQSFKVSFYLRSNYENKEGKSPVMLRIFLGGAMSNLGSTKIFVDKAQWNSRTSRQKGRSSEALAVNASLDAISTSLHSLYHKYQDDQTIRWTSFAPPTSGRSRSSAPFSPSLTSSSMISVSAWGTPSARRACRSRASCVGTSSSS